MTIPQTSINEIFGQSSMCNLTGIEIPIFANKYSEIITQFGDSKTQQFFQKNIILAVEKLSMVLSYELTKR